MFSATNNENKNNSWENIFSLAVDQHYDESQEKDNNKAADEEANYFSMDLSFDEEEESKDKLSLEKDLLSDYGSTDNESYGSRSSSCISINSFYSSPSSSFKAEARPKFTSLLSENFLKTIENVKSKAVEVMNAQKIINAKRMMMVGMLQKQAMVQMIAKNNTVKAKVQETTTNAATATAITA